MWCWCWWREGWSRPLIGRVSRLTAIAYRLTNPVTELIGNGWHGKGVIVSRWILAFSIDSMVHMDKRLVRVNLQQFSPLALILTALAESLFHETLHLGRRSGVYLSLGQTPSRTN